MLIRFWNTLFDFRFVNLNLTCTILALDTSPLLVYAGQAKSSNECLVLSIIGPVDQLPLRTDHWTRKTWLLRVCGIQSFIYLLLLIFSSLQLGTQWRSYYLGTLCNGHSGECSELPAVPDWHAQRFTHCWVASQSWWTSKLEMWWHFIGTPMNGSLQRFSSSRCLRACTRCCNAYLVGSCFQELRWAWQMPPRPMKSRSFNIKAGCNRMVVLKLGEPLFHSDVAPKPTKKRPIADVEDAPQPSPAEKSPKTKASQEQKKKWVPFRIAALFWRGVQYEKSCCFLSALWGKVCACVCVCVCRTDLILCCFMFFSLGRPDFVLPHDFFT